MVYSRYGCEVEAIKDWDEDKGQCSIHLVGDPPDKWREEYPMICLHADGGREEILGLVKQERN